MNGLFRHFTIGIAGLMVGGISAVAQPSINGSVAFIGGATLDGPMDTATAFTSFFGSSGSGTPTVLAGSQTGDYLAVPDNTPATFTLFTFNPPAPSVIPLWTLMVGAVSYSFDATSVVDAFQNSVFLDLQGTGVAHITGFADTVGTWSITDTGLGSVPVFTFGAGVQVVPEPSSIALLLVGASVFAFRAKAKR